MKDTASVMQKLDAWVGSVGNGRYQPENNPACSTNLSVLPVFGMQQVRAEIEEFTQVLVNRDLQYTGVAVEIGLGHFGSSHFLWRHLFNKVLTVEINHHRVNRFSLNLEKHYGYDCLSDKKSMFVINPSASSYAVGKVYSHVSNIDMLFIDGEHSYSAVLADWLLYAPLVQPGGLVAFHDCQSTDGDGGVKRFLEDLQQGKFVSVGKINNIIHSDNVGISYYEVA
jgi:hypothetical protein